MIYTRRHFLKAAGSGVALTVIGGETALFGAVAPVGSVAFATPMSKEKATFVINGKPYPVGYEARTTLWEVIAMQLGLVGTNRSCNRASCGACSVLVDGQPFYSCHTLATEAVGKKISPSKAWATRTTCIRLQHVGYIRCGGRLRLLHGGLGGHRERISR